MASISRHLCLLAGFVVCVAAGLAQSADESRESLLAKAKLADVRQRIAAITQKLGGELNQRDALQARLREADLAITDRRRRVDGLRVAQQGAERRRAELRDEEVRARSALDAERARLGAEARTAYMNGRLEELKLLLNQNDPAAAGRMAVYYGYFVRDRARRIEEVNERVAKVQALAAQSDDNAAKLQALQKDAVRELSELRSAKSERVAALAAINQDVTSGSEELARLKREEQAEEALVADLAQILQDVPVDTQQSFESMRGKLAWPVSGHLAARYQEPRANSAGLRWNGVMIEGRPGAKVRAPYFGRVVYADWLQGLGLLIIIGHTGDYMTLYGHAEVLYKSVGDWVAPGDVIASLSDSSGAGPQLYFEIREGRKTVDPGAWLRAAP